MSTKKKKLKVEELHLYTTAFDGDVSKDRETYIGGSDVGTILGFNKFKSPYELFLEKTGQIDRESLDDRLQIKLGHKMEQVVAELYEEETGAKTQMSNRSYRCKEYPFLVGHIDRKIQKRKKGLEIKTTSSHNRTDYTEGEVPPTHYYQCMFYMIITGMHDWDLATLRDNNGFYITHIKWDKQVAEDMLDRILAFWECVKNKTWTLEIDGTDSTSIALDKAYPVSVEKQLPTVINSNETITSIEQYYEAKKAIADLQEIANSFENEVKSLMQENENAIVNNQYRVSWKTSTRAGGYDVKKYLADHPKSELTKYKKPDTTVRRFTIKEIKQVKEIKGE